MRQEKTPWNMSYKGDSTAELARELRAKRRREINRTGAQRLQAQHWDKFFQIHGNKNVARQRHPDDVAIGLTRRAAEERQEDRKLREDLKEVWD